MERMAIFHDRGFIVKPMSAGHIYSQEYIVWAVNHFISIVHKIHSNPGTSILKSNIYHANIE